MLLVIGLPHAINPISFFVIAGKDGAGLSLIEQNWVGC